MADYSDNLRAQLLEAAELLIEIADEAPTGEDDEPVPLAFLCPYTRKIMIDPVFLSNGHTCERANIKKLFDAGSKTCLLTGQILDPTFMRPNDLARELIHDWCNKHFRYTHLFDYSHATPTYMKLGYFLSLHKKLHSKTLLEDKKVGAKQLVKEVTRKSYFRELYAERPDAVTHLLCPLIRSDVNSTIDPQIQEDVITVLMIISADAKVKKTIAENAEGVRILVEALRAENLVVRGNGASTIFHLSSTNLNGAKPGIRESIVELATVLVEERGARALNDAGSDLLRLCYNSTNKETAVPGRLLAVIFKKIRDNECLDIMLEILVHSSAIRDGAAKIEKYGCLHLVQVIRWSSSDRNIVNAGQILSNVLIKEASKWKYMLKRAEMRKGILSEIVANGTPLAKVKAQEILAVLDSL